MDDSGRTSKTRRRGPALGTRFFLATALLVIFAIALALAVTWLVGGQVGDRAARRALERSSRAQLESQKTRFEQLRLIAYTLAGDPDFAPYVQRSIEDGDVASLRDQLDERRQDLGFGFAMLIDPDGRLLAGTGELKVAGEDFSREPLYLEAASDEYLEAAGLWTTGDRLFHAMAVPVAAAGELVAFLIAAYAIDDTAALELREINNTEVAFVLTGPRPAGDGSPTLAAKTLGPAAAEELLGFPSGWSGPAESYAEIELQRQQWLALSRPLTDVAGERLGAVVHLTSLDVELAPFRRIGSTLLAVGLLTVLLAVVVSYFLPRRVLRPVHRLASAAKAAAEGDLDQRIEVERADEIGQLADAFNVLLSELREKRDMEIYVNELARNLPDAESVASEVVPADQDATRPMSEASGPSSAMASAAGQRRFTLSGVGPGSVLGDRFEVLRELGAGGMGVVYQARDRALGELVALKMLKQELWGDGERLERLKDELKLARKISHPNVLRTFDFGDYGGHPFISMEFVRGVTLRQVLDRSGRLPLSAGLHTARQLCRGLAAAHGQGVLHRDIKPENLIIEANGNVKLMDFGIARPLQRVGPGKTRAGVVIGTPHYLAPEQLEGKDADERTDIYACGVVFYEIFTGALPFPAGGSLLELINRKMREPPAPPHRHWPEMPAVLERLILRCLDSVPEKRYRDVGAVLQELEALRA